MPGTGMTTDTPSESSSGVSVVPIKATAPNRRLLAPAMKIFGAALYFVRRLFGMPKADASPPAKPLSNDQLLALAAQRRPPQSWYDEPSALEPNRR